MERLYDNAARGDMKALRQLLENDPFLLERVSYINPNNTPLHIAATKGNLPFVEEILRLNPHLAEELNSQQSSPLHMASFRGHVEIAKKLADAAPDMCLSLDSQGRNPLHLAAIKGHVKLLEELVSRAPLAAREKVGRGLTVLHLCVKHGQLEALKVSVKEVDEMMNAKNDDGDNTILHTAVMGKKIMKYLFENTNINVNAKNSNGKTAKSIHEQSQPTPTNFIAEHLSFCEDIELAEGLSCLKGIRMAITEGIRDLIIELDNLNLVSFLQQNKIPRTQSGTIIAVILHLALDFNQISFRWIDRSANQCGHRLANFARNHRDELATLDLSFVLSLSKFSSDVISVH